MRIIYNKMTVFAMKPRSDVRGETTGAATPGACSVGCAPACPPLWALELTEGPATSAGDRLPQPKPAWAAQPWLDCQQLLNVALCWWHSCFHSVCDKHEVTPNARKFKEGSIFCKKAAVFLCGGDLGASPHSDLLSHCDLFWLQHLPPTSHKTQEGRRV